MPRSVVQRKCRTGADNNPGKTRFRMKKLWKWKRSVSRYHEGTRQGIGKLAFYGYGIESIIPAALYTLQPYFNGIRVRKVCNTSEIVQPRFYIQEIRNKADGVVH
ncbi:hypothetical protein Mapa_008827 [Marchantia paleacea]|nr:hypothetical protein Mapa_008827 [Marchantia paleacea]